MKEFTVIVRNRNTGKLKSLEIKAENFLKAISEAVRTVSTKGHFEYMYHKEKIKVIKGKKK